MFGPRDKSASKDQNNRGLSLCLIYNTKKKTKLKTNQYDRGHRVLLERGNLGVTRKIKAAFTNLLERWSQFTTNPDSRESR